MRSSREDEYCAVAEIDVTDPTRVRGYVANVTAMVERHGGGYLARTPQVHKIEGERALPQRFLIIECPSRGAPDAFYASDE
jgi:uncharacterized protein (DUF1330 family)